MARNRSRTESSAVRFAPALKAILLCLFLGGSAVGYVMQKNKIYELGRQIREREARLDRLHWENKMKANQLADLQLPQKLAQRVKDERLGLLPPLPGQIIWLTDPALPAAQRGPELLVSRESSITRNP